MKHRQQLGSFSIQFVQYRVVIVYALFVPSLCFSYNIHESVYVNIRTSSNM